MVKEVIMCFKLKAKQEISDKLIKLKEMRKNSNNVEKAIELYYNNYSYFLYCFVVYCKA